jgi:hypothetical protein
MKIEHSITRQDVGGAAMLVVMASGAAIARALEWKYWLVAGILTPVALAVLAVSIIAVMLVVSLILLRLGL